MKLVGYIDDDVNLHKGYHGTITSSGTIQGKMPVLVKKGETIYRMTGIGEWTFAEVSDLTSIEIPPSVTNISSKAFRFSGLSTDDMEGLVVIDDVLYTYKGTMPENTSIEIPKNIRIIADSAFSGCSGLTSIEIPSSVTSIGSYAFDGTTWYNNQPDGLIMVLE